MRRGRRARRATPTRIPRSASNGHILHRPQDPTLDFWRAATCAEIECDGWRLGFALRIDEATPLGQAQAAYLRADRTRRAVESRDPLGLTVFTYEPGQRCTASDDIRHRVPVEREPLYILRDPRRGRREVGQTQWTDTLGEHVERYAAMRARG
jgi:hypothetical protein